VRKDYLRRILSRMVRNSQRPYNPYRENLKVNFDITCAIRGKGTYGLVDGAKGKFNINWIGWYGTNPEIELITKKLAFNQIKINFLDDQRHWIFIPAKITVYGSNEKNGF
jgi:hypothetical protein